MLGFLLGISTSVAIASLGIIFISQAGLIRKNLITGAVIGTTGIISYALIAFVISIVITSFLIIILKNKSK